MANPNIATYGAGTRFQTGHQVKAQVGQNKAKISNQFLVAFLADFQEHGAETIVKLRDTDPATYCKIAASFVPKELEVTRPLQDISDEELNAIIAAVRETITVHAQSDGDGTSVPESGQPYIELQALQ